MVQTNIMTYAKIVDQTEGYIYIPQVNNIQIYILSAISQLCRERGREKEKKEREKAS